MDRLKAVVSSLDERATETITLIADLLAVPTGEHPPFGAADPQQRREMTLAMLVHQIEMLSRQTPVLVVFEDAHWADSTSLELLDRAIARARQLPVMIVISFRPEFIPPWLGQAQVTTVALNRLAQRETAILVDRVSGGKTLPAEILADRRAHGRHPAFCRGTDEGSFGERPAA